MSRPQNRFRLLQLALARAIRHDCPVNTASQNLPHQLDVLYFESVDTGLMALIPGVKGGTEVARFRLAGPAVGNPKHN
jgi:hypothetical protein